MPYDNCLDCKKCFPCPVTNGNKDEGAYPISQDTGDIWYCTSCFYCEDVCPEYSPRQFAIDRRRMEEKNTDRMIEPLKKIRTYGSMFDISQSLIDFRLELGLPEILKPKINEIRDLFEEILDNNMLAKTKPEKSITIDNNSTEILQKAKNALFLGCLIPYRISEYEISARNIMNKLDIEYIDLAFACCGSIMTESYSELLWLTIGAYNLAIAEESGVENIITLCGGCAGNLRRINDSLLEKKENLEKVNSHLAKISKKYSGKVTIQHLSEFLIDFPLIEKIHPLLQDERVEILKSLSVGLQIPCQIIRPEKHSPKALLETKLLENLLDLTGVNIIHYPFELLCCGSSMLQYDEKLALKIAEKRIKSLQKRNVDALILGCGNCSMNFNIHQSEYSKIKLPTFFFTEILDYATGITNKKIEELIKKK